MVDLFDESGEDLSLCGYQTVKLNKYNIICNKLFVDTPLKSKNIGFSQGHYFIINTPLISNLMQEHKDILFNEISYRLKFLVKENNLKKKDRILFVGIGNPNIIADSFGPKVVEKIDISPFKKNNRFYKLIPNTFLNTGIGAFSLIRLLVEGFDISAVFMFDSLATTNINRLGCSIQFNDAGLTPGSALNNFGQTINKNSLNVPCFSIGVPMMISSKNLGEKREIILTEKDAEEKINFLSSLISEVIENVLM